MTLDKRTSALADKIFGYSMRLDRKDTVLIFAERPFAPVARVFGDRASESGADVRYQIVDPQREAQFIANASEEDLAQEAQRWQAMIDGATARVRLDASEDPDHLSVVPAQNVARWREVVYGPYLDRVTGDGKNYTGIAWNVCGYPSHTQAKSAGMPFTQYADFVFDSILKPDWPAMAQQMTQAKAAMDGAKEVRIIVRGDTDLRLSLEGRGAEICAGKYNMPDGEFFYGPVEGSVDGYIRFPYSTSYNSNKVRDVRLVFENGRAVIDRCTAQEGQEFLRQTLRSPGADMPGELGIGCNYGITRSIANILFDEKIGGTIHLAMGDSYKVPLNAGGGLNTANEHWDLIAELRPVNGHPGGELYVDGKRIQKDGEWLL